MLELINHIVSKIYSSHWFTVVVGLIGILIGNWLSIGREKRKEFAQAGNEFRKSINVFLVMLETNFRHENGRFNIPIPDHLAAAKLFRQHLDRFRRKRFDKKLVQYNKAAEKYADEAEKCLGTKNVSHDTKLKLIKVIDSLLKYAKPK